MLTKKGTKALASILVAPGTGVADIRYDRNADILTIFASAPARDFGVLVKTYHLSIDQGYYKARYEKDDDTVIRFSRMFGGNKDVHGDIVGEDTVEKPSDDLTVFHNVIEACDRIGEYPCLIEIFCPAPTVHPAGTLPDFAWEDNDIQVASPADRKTVQEFVTELQKVLPEGVFLLYASLKEGRACIEWCTKETLNFVPPSPMWEKEHAGDIYRQNADGTSTLEVFRLGDRNVRDCKDGPLSVLFENWNPDVPEHCLYRLLTKYYGVALVSVESEQLYWEDLGALGWGEHETDLPFYTPWVLEEDAETPWPLHQRVCMYTRNHRRVYTRTDLDDDRGREGCCEVYTDWYGFLAGPYPDITFTDTDRNRERFIDALESAEDIANVNPDTFKETFLAALRERMGDAVIAEPADGGE